MSDDFITVATQEIRDDVLGMSNIMNSCQNDINVYDVADELKKHTHKIKGLSPMMGNDDLGSLSASLDLMLKNIVEGKKFEGVFDIMSQSIIAMNLSLDNSPNDLNLITDKIKEIL
jgi:HPt (histidine-containing phosphotransfer) domain-containing protein